MMKRYTRRVAKVEINAPSQSRLGNASLARFMASMCFRWRIQDGHVSRQALISRDGSRVAV